MARFPLLMALILIACVRPSSDTPQKEPLGDGGTMTVRYLALGDSYTIGEAVREDERWPNQVTAALSQEGQPVELTLIARTGWTVDELEQGILADPPQGSYRLVTLLIGVNDQYRGYPLEGYREDFRAMLGRAVEYAGGEAGRVIVVSIPDWGFTPFAAGRETETISRQIDEFNAVNFEEAGAAGAAYADVTAISRMALDDFELIAGDGLHPSGRMYRLWAEKILPIARRIVSAN
jgi:lysophospholipase L1-like esterase